MNGCDSELLWKTVGSIPYSTPAAQCGPWAREENLLKNGIKKDGAPGHLNCGAPFLCSGANIQPAGRRSRSAVPDQVNLGEDGIAVNQVGRMQAAGQTAPKTQQAAPRTDIVEISEEGKAASAQLAAQAQQTQQTGAAPKWRAYPFFYDKLPPALPGGA